MRPTELFPNAKPLGVNGGDACLDFRAFVEKHGLVFIDSLEYDIPRYGHVGEARYFTRRFAPPGAPAPEAEVLLRVYSDASFGVYAKLPGKPDAIFDDLATLGFDRSDRQKAL